MMQLIEPESGILLVDKPVDWTSHDVVNCVRRRFRIRKVGHCGTLDPGATGLLVLVLGRATKLSARFSGQDKTYAGIMRLGVETDTQDADGTVTGTADVSAVTEDEVRSVSSRFVGNLEQVPPMVSAVKKDGQPLYKLARKGKVVERDARPITIYRLTVADVRLPDVDFEVECSKGTYVRTLCVDIGTELGCGAHLLSLRRLRSGRFPVEDSFPIDTIKNWEREQLMNAVIPLMRVFSYLDTPGPDVAGAGSSVSETS